MGDKNKLPRTWAGQLGVKDVDNALKRHILVCNVRTTTATGIGNGTTGGLKFNRPVQVQDPIRVSLYLDRTTSHLHKFRLRLRSKTSTIASFPPTGTNPAYGSTGNLWGATTGWKTLSGPGVGRMSSAITTSEEMHYDVLKRTDATSRISLFLTVLTREDGFTR
jgi:hypothetical protein